MPDFESKYNEARAIIQEWVDKQGHERCWYYPDLFRKLAVTFEIEPTHSSSLPALEEFKKGCERYQQEEYKQNKS